MAIPRLVPIGVLLTLVLSIHLDDLLHGQSQDPVFRGGVDLVRLDVFVLDADRRPVAGLTAADFTVIEDDEPREIQTFAAVDLPAAPRTSTSAAWTREVASDVATNDMPADGRLAVILFDHSIPTGPMIGTARRIAHAAVDALGPNDLAAVVRSQPFAGEGFVQNFTADRTLLREAIDSPFVGLTKQPPDARTIGTGADWIPGLADGEAACPCGICQWHALEHLATTLAEVDNRQKSIFFVGREIYVNEAPAEDAWNSCDSRVAQARDRTLRALDRANVTIHALDPGGLETLAASASGMPRTPAAVDLQRQNDLAVLPAYTGGRTVLGTNAPESQVAGIFDETSHYYQLGFVREPRTPDSRADRRRRIQVRVNRPGVTVRTRTGSYASPDGPAPANVGGDEADIVDAMLPVTDLPLSLAAVPRFAADGTPQVALLLGLDAAVDRTRPADGADTVAFRTTIAVFDAYGRRQGVERQTIEVPTGDSISRSRPVETLTWLPLPPGRYEIRAGVEDVASGTSGSVHAFAVVAEGGDETALGNVLLDREGTPTLVREFDAGEEVVASIQVRRPADVSTNIVLAMHILDAEDVVAWQSAPALAEDAFAGGSVAEVRSRLPLETLAPGEYLLHVSLAGEHRRVRFVRR